MSTTAYQIKLELSGSKPKIWRRLMIPADMLLSDLHKVIQTSMGWTNSHLYQFVKGRVFLEPPVDDDFLDSAGIDYTGYTISKLLEKKNDKIVYEYDFGDGWEHTITLETVHTAIPLFRFDHGFTHGTLPKILAGINRHCFSCNVSAIWTL